MMIFSIFSLGGMEQLSLHWTQIAVTLAAPMNTNRRYKIIILILLLNKNIIFGKIIGTAAAAPDPTPMLNIHGS